MKNILFYIIIFTLPIFGKGGLEDDNDVIIRDHFHYFINKVDRLEVEIDFKMGQLDLLPNKENPTDFDGFSKTAQSILNHRMYITMLLTKVGN